MFSTCKKHWIAVIASIVMFVTMFPVATGGNPWPIENFTCIFAWFFLVPIWIVLRGESPRRIMTSSYIYCFFSTVGTLFWFYIAMKKYGDMPSWESILILAGAGFLVGTIRWFAFVVTAKHQQIRYFPLFAALVFALIEWLMLYIPFQGFPWITPAYAIIPMNHLVQSVDFLGMTGINFLLFYTNFLVVEYVVEHRRGNSPSQKPLKAMIVVLVCLYIYGHFQIKKYNEPTSGETLQVSLLQGNISQDIKWSVRDRENIIQTYQDLTRLAAAGKPDMIVWPEASFPKTINVDRDRLDAIPTDLKEGTFIVGAPTWFGEGKKIMYQNSAFTLSADGMVQHRYDKVRLVPFGEYVPSFGIPIEKIVPAMAGNFSAGKLDQSISQVNGHPFGLFICFEVLFPNIAQSWVNKGAEFFVTITNDAWFDRSSGPYQHLRFANLLAMEFRKPIVRAANTGVTTWFDAAGIQHESLNLFERGYITAMIHPNKIKTVYAQFPHAIPAFLWIATLYILVLARRRVP